MSWYLLVLQKYAVFTGRASRREYWMFALFNILFAILAMVLDNVLGITMRGTGYGPIYLIYALGTFIPGLAVAVRRLHDIGKSGWWFFIGLIPFVGGIWLIILLASRSIAPDEDTPDAVNDKWRGSEMLDAPLDGAQAANPQGDGLILAVLIWMAFNTVFWRVLPLIFEEYYMQSWFQVVNIVLSLVWAGVPFALAFAIRDRTKKTVAIVIAGLYAIGQLYSAFSEYF